MGSGEDPDVLLHEEQVRFAREDHGDVLVVRVEYSVVAGGYERGELQLGLGAVEDCHSVCISNFVCLLIVL